MAERERLFGGAVAVGIGLAAGLSLGAGLAAYYCAGRERAARAALDASRRECAKWRAEKKAERSGRIEAEKELKSLRLRAQASEALLSKGDAAGAGDGGDGEQDQALPQAYTLSPIGFIRTCFSRRSGTPRQPHLVPAARGVVTLKRELPKDILSGLGDYSHCWVIYVFHQNTNLHQDWSKMKGKVNVPRLNGGRVGALATRTPHRPNAIGLSTAKVESVTDKTVLLSGVDLVDGSPILDIKPYVPFCDAIGDASQPEWVTRDREVEEEPLHVSRVSISQEPWNRLRECWQRVGGEASLYEDFGTLVDLVRQVLSRDIRSLHQRGALALTAKTGSANHGKRQLGKGVEGSAANVAATAAATVYHLHLLGRIDISYVHERKEIEVIDATIV